MKTVLDHRKKGEEITDPEQLTVEGAGYIYSMYKRFGVVRGIGTELFIKNIEMER